MSGALREKAIAWLMNVNGQPAEEIGRNLQHGEVESLTALLESVERQAQADQFVGTGPYHSLIADNMLHERRRIVAWLRAGRAVCSRHAEPWPMLSRKVSTRARLQRNPQAEPCAQETEERAEWP
jgi:hypothetical protein